MQNKRAYIWSLIGRILPQAIYLITTMILARFLMPSDFGILGILSVFLMVANTLLDAGFGGSLINEKEVTSDDCSTVFTFSLCMSLFLYIIMFCLAPILEIFYDVDGFTSIIRLLCLIFIIQSFTLVPSSILTKQLQFEKLTIIRIVAVIVASILSIIYAFYYKDVYALVIYQISQAIVIAILFNFHSPWSVHLCFKKESFDKLFSFGLYTTLANIIDTIYENLLAVILGKALSVEEAGYLTQAKRIEEVSTQTVTQTINSTSFPILSKKKDLLSEFIKEMNSIFMFSLQNIIPLMSLLCIYSKPLIIILFGRQWTNAAEYLSLLAIAGVFIIMENINRTFIKSLGKVSTLFKVSIIKRGVGVFLLFTCLFINVKFIMYGYIASSVLAYIINQLVLCRYISFSFWKSMSELFRIIIPTLVFTIVNLFIVFLTDSIFAQITTSILTLSLYYCITNRNMLSVVVKKFYRK